MKMMSCTVVLLLCSAAQAQQWGDPILADPAEPAASQTVQPAPSAASPVAPAAAQPSALEPLPPRPRLSVMRELLGLPGVLPLARQGAALSLNEAARLGLGNSPDVQVAMYRAQSASETRKVARGALLPRLELRSAHGVGQLDSVEPAQRLHREEHTAVLSQPVFDEVARQEWRRQGLLSSSAEAQLAATESQALLDVGTAWLGVMQQRAGLALGSEYEALLGELLRYVSERAAAGGTSPAERERVAARVANVRSGLADSRAGLQAALRNFQRLTAAAPAALSLLDDAATFDLPADPETALAQAQAGNAELQAARLDQEAAEAERRGRRGAFLPRLAIEITHLRSTNVSGTEAYQRDTKAMAVLTLPLFSGGADLAQMRAAEAHRNELEARLEGATRRVVQDVETAYANLRAAGERFGSVRDELEANRKVLDAFRAQLIGGNRPLLDVLDAYQRLHQSRLDLVQVIVASVQNEWRIAHLTGRLRDVAAGR